jgi:hypothetical protein
MCVTTDAVELYDIHEITVTPSCIPKGRSLIRRTKMAFRAPTGQWRRGRKGTETAAQRYPSKASRRQYRASVYAVQCWLQPKHRSLSRLFFHAISRLGDCRSAFSRARCSVTVPRERHWHVCLHSSCKTRSAFAENFFNSRRERSI